MSTARHRVVTAVVYALTVTPVLHWLILHHSVAHGQPWRTHCKCGYPLWPSACGPAGRCRACGVAPGPPAYLIEAITVAAASVALRSAHGPWQIAATLWWTAGAVVLATVDASLRRLPYRITAATTAGFLLLQSIAADLSGLARAMLAATVLAASFAVVAYMMRRQLGWGDVALAAPVAAFLGVCGWTAVLRGYLAGFAAALAYLVVARCLRGPARSLPLGPFLLAGALIGAHL